MAHLVAEMVEVPWRHSPGPLISSFVAYSLNIKDQLGPQDIDLSSPLQFTINHLHTNYQQPTTSTSAPNDNTGSFSQPNDPSHTQDAFQHIFIQVLWQRQDAFLQHLWWKAASLQL